MFIAQVRRELGRPYLYGADGPNAFDCSGLVFYCCAQVGIKGCPRTSEEQFAWTERVTSPQAGDLVFFVGAEEDPPPGHVGVVVAPGTMIDAPHTGSVVQQTLYGVSGVGVNEFMGYGRIPGIAGSTTANQALFSTPDQNKTGMLGSISFMAILGFLALVAVVIVVILALWFTMKYH